MKNIIIEDKNRVTPFTYEGGTVIAVAKNTPHADGYQLCFEKSGWRSPLYNRDYLISIGCNPVELDNIEY